MQLNIYCIPLKSQQINLYQNSLKLCWSDLRSINILFTSFYKQASCTYVRKYVRTYVCMCVYMCVHCVGVCACVYLHPWPKLKRNTRKHHGYGYTFHCLWVWCVFYMYVALLLHGLNETCPFPCTPNNVPLTRYLKFWLFYGVLWWQT